MEATADTTLVTAARDGDSAAFGGLFERYQSRIYNYAYGIAGNPEDAGDIAQEAFVRVFEALPRLTGELNFSAYLYRTAHNVAVDTVKSRSRFAPPDALDLQYEPSLRADPERVALVQDQQEKTWRAAFQLSENHRAILSLRELHEMSYQDIADIMDMPRNTVGVLLSRARLKFKEAFRMSSIDVDKLTEECRGMLPLLSAYIDDELDAQKQARVESHLELCAFCRLALEEMTESSRSYRALLPLLPPATLRDGVWTRLGDLLGPDEAQASPGEARSTGSEAAQAERSPGVKAAHEAGSAGTADTAGKGAGKGLLETVIRRPGAKMLALAAGTLALALVGGWLLSGVPARFAEGDTGPIAPATSTTEDISGGAEGGTTDALGGPSSSPGSGATSTTSTRPTSSASPETTAPPSTGADSTSAQPAGTSPTSGSTNPPEDTDPPSGTPEPPGSTGTADSTDAGSAGTGDQPAGTTSTASTRPPDTQAPPTPKPLSPASGDIVKSAKVTLRWSAVKDPSGVTYRVEVQAYSEKAGGYVTVQSASGLRDTELGHVMTSPRERWRVMAVDGAGNASGPSPWSKFAQAVASPSTGPTTTTTVILY